MVDKHDDVAAPADPGGEGWVLSDDGDHIAEVHDGSLDLALVGVDAVPQGQRVDVTALLPMKSGTRTFTHIASR